MGLYDATDPEASTVSFGALLRTNPAMVNTEARIPIAHSTVFIGRFCGLVGGIGGFLFGSMFFLFLSTHN
jgi:hypothetical protein